MISIFSVTLVTLYGQTRILFAMGRDRMLPDQFAAVNPRTLTPTFNTVVVGVVVSLIAGFVPSDYLWDTVSIGTLVAFSVVAAGVIILRRTKPDLERPFRVPGYPVTPVLTVAACVYVLSGLAAITWVIFGVWLAIVLAFYFSWGRHNSRLEHGERERSDAVMTLWSASRPGKDDRAGLELAALLARSDGDDLRIVTVVPAWWPTPVAGGADREYAEWSRPHGEAAVAEATALLGRTSTPTSRSRRPGSSGRSVSSALLAQSEEHDARVRRRGLGTRAAATGTSTSARRPTCCCTRRRSRRHRPARLRRAARARRSRGRRAPSAATTRRAGCSTAPPSLCAEIGAALRVATFAVRGRTMYPPETGLRDEDMVMDAWIEQTGSLQAEALDALPEPRPARRGGRRPRLAAGRRALDRLEWERGDLLVVGSSRTGLAARLFLGSNATKILRASPVPVIVVP